jgi:methenyltetrahydromethanopterin cyclohydrolase
MTETLNDAAAALCDDLAAQADALRVRVGVREGGTRIIDCGVEAPGGLEAGLRLARICVSDLAEIALVPAGDSPLLGWKVAVRSDDPVRACMASQYAGWEVKGAKFFAMGSGPMRAAAAREPLFAELGYRETPRRCVGVLETARLPTDEVCRELAEKCGVAPAALTLLAAPTRSLAGTLQVVARSLETALHKLHELGFPLQAVVSGCATAPLPPPARDDLASIGRTNDAVLYGGDATLFVRGEDDRLAELVQRAPSSASPDYGRPFAEILAACGGDFYRIDPLLFSPARVTLVNLATGRSHRHGRLDEALLERSFFAP